MRKTTENLKKFRNTVDKEKAKNDEDEDSFSAADLSEEMDNLHELPDKRDNSPQRQNFARPEDKFSAIL